MSGLKKGSKSHRQRLVRGKVKDGESMNDHWGNRTGGNFRAKVTKKQKSERQDRKGECSSGREES